jgi:hypothetical protein
MSIFTTNYWKEYKYDHAFYKTYRPEHPEVG